MEERPQSLFSLENRVAPLGIIALEGAEELGEKIDAHLVRWARNAGMDVDSFRLRCSCPRFGSGDAKGIIEQTVRGYDLYIVVDVGNYSPTYPYFGMENHMSPDDHFQNLKRIIQAASGKAHRLNVIMPVLYGGRQHRRNYRESLDCAFALQELQSMGVENVVTFDAHDPRVQNAEPLRGFDNFTPPYQFTQALLRTDHSLLIDKEHLIVISPDEGALDRAVYFASVLGVDTGMFYKRRDYSRIVNGKNPIVAHEFLGDNIDGKDIIIMDDIIASGGSMIDTARKLKEMNAKRVYICCTFGLFTEGLEKFDEAYEKCYFDKVITTNLTYQPPELKSKPYYVEADMSKFLASIIDFMNHDSSMANVYTPTDKIHEILTKYNNRELYLDQEDHA